jgi:hypothetical protein
MSSISRRLPVAAVASLSLLGGGVALLAGWSNRAPTGDGSNVAAATTDQPTTTMAAASTTIGGGSTSTTVVRTTTTHPAGFIDAAEARDAAQGLVSAYIDSRFDAAVVDPACSLPTTGAVGDEFVCYALRPGDLVIALRATIGDDRVITLALITDQGAPTTTTTTTTIAGATVTSTTG